MQTERDIQDPGRRRRGGFFWGLALGLLGALAVIVAADLGLQPLPLRGTGTASAQPSAAASGAQRLFLAGALSPGMQVVVDGKAVQGIREGEGTVIEVGRGARKVEVRTAAGPLWSARLDPTAVATDTLQPVFGGEIVVEADRLAPRGALFLDGTLAGAAPATLSEVVPGWHVLSVRDGAKVLYEDACVVRPGHVTLVSIPALPAHGKGGLIVRSRLLAESGMEEGSGDRVWLDGEPAGGTPVNRLLPSGFHSVRVERAGFPDHVDVLYLEAGRSVFVDAQFGGVEPLGVSARPPAGTTRGMPLAVPVAVGAAGETVVLSEGSLHLVRGGQPTTVSIPLVASGTDPRLWVAVLPEELTAGGGTLSGYVACQDDQGRRGVSDIFQITIR